MGAIFKTFLAQSFLPTTLTPMFKISVRLKIIKVLLL